MATNHYNLFSFQVYLRDLRLPVPSPCSSYDDDASFNTSQTDPALLLTGVQNHIGTRFTIPNYDMELVVDICVPIAHFQLKVAIVLFLVFFSSSRMREAFVPISVAIFCLGYGLYLIELFGVLLQGRQNAIKLLDIIDTLWGSEEHLSAIPQDSAS
ncbi:hypothetical protein BDN72DRAFT_176459 [Pluteus cervinus]|uniref:Uncharacterized protein n=1 Tax=Pluteus cervinus TaxID=181527 RepID=A0ACD3AJP4_9AGAR|nr:hypothetical protein BDN72DRAFT_176459 [Pluteus cervinus]